MSRASAIVLVFVWCAQAQVAGPEQMVKGMNFIRFGADYAYDSQRAYESLERLRATGVNWVAIVPVWWMADTGSAEVFWLSGRSPGDGEVRRIIRRAHDSGLKVLLKPEVHCISGVEQREHDPPDSSWFVSYQVFLLRYAGIAQQTGCEMFAIGTELDRTADEPWEVARWEALIREVRRRYSGQLVYAADWRMYQSISFWGLLDFIGINGYFPVGAERGADTWSDRFNCFAAGWKRWVAQIDSFWKGQGDSSKPIVFTEIGYRSVSGGGRYPGEDTISGSFDEEEQRSGYLAALHSLLGKFWFAGWFWYCWTTDPDQGGAGDLSYSPRQKRAQEVLRRWNASIGSHRGFCFPSTDDFVYFSPRTYQALDSLVQHHANWVAINVRWMMADTGVNYGYIRPVAGQSPIDGSIRAVIDSAHRLGLNVALNCYIAPINGVWCGRHNPDGNGKWFRDESVYVSYCARLAEAESVEMLVVGLEIDGTMDSVYEAELWRRMILPVVRQVYSGPLAYGASSSVVHPYFWDGVDFCGVQGYLGLATGSDYAGQYPADTAYDQRPGVEDLVERGKYSWQRWWIPWIEKWWYRVNEKPVLFTEIGYRSLDSTAVHPAYDYWYGWRKLPSDTEAVTRQRLYSVCFPVDTITGYIVGDSGIILKTTDSGSTWRFCRSGTGDNLYSVHFVSRDTGYAVGANGVILRTTDGGISYENIAVAGLEVDYYSVGFSDDGRLGYVVGEGGVILKTSDSGDFWQRLVGVLPAGETVRLRSVGFVSGSSGGLGRVAYVVGDRGTVLRTTDAGVSWHKLNIPVKVNLNDVEFVSSRTGFIVGDSGVVLYTTDRGRSWSVYQLRDRTRNLYSVSVPEPDSARFIVGTDGIILRAGDDWSLDGAFQVYLFGRHRPTLRSVQCRLVPRAGYYDLVGFAVGDSGMILKTSSGGRMRVDFNEQANCYEAAFRAFWKDPVQPRPLPWFYGFHFWKWLTEPVPLDNEHEAQLDDYTPQQKRAGEVVRKWFKPMR